VGSATCPDLFSGPPSLHAPINSDAEVRAILHRFRLPVLASSHHLLLRGERLQYGQRWCLRTSQAASSPPPQSGVSPGVGRFKPPSNDTFLGIPAAFAR
jgi:hypothetical protein